MRGRRSGAGRRTAILLLSSALLSAPTTTGCRTTAGTAVPLPPKPERQPQAVPADARDAALLLLYYESLVQKWEAWGAAVEEVAQGGAP